MSRIVIPCLTGRVLGHTVYRGYVSAKELFPTLWIDRFDETDNPLGYQRPYDESRSEEAAKYAEEGGAFWYEAVLNVRILGNDNERDESSRELGIPRESVTFTTEKPQSVTAGFLSVEFDETTKQVGGKTVPWNRAFSVVDSQHRLMGLAGKDISIPVCIFIGLPREIEATIFKDINDNQKPMPTKLVNTILVRTEGPLARPDVAIAKRLHEDPASPFHGHVDQGGAKVRGKIYLATTEGLRIAIEASLGEFLEEITNTRLPANDRSTQLDKSYLFVNNFWKAVASVWPSAWDFTELAEPKPRVKYGFQQYKLLTTPGINALSQLAYDLLKQKVLPANDFSEDHLRRLLLAGREFDWDKDSSLMRGVAGPGGAKPIYAELRKVILPARL